MMCMGKKGLDGAGVFSGSFGSSGVSVISGSDGREGLLGASGVSVSCVSSELSGALGSSGSVGVSDVPGVVDSSGVSVDGVSSVGKSAVKTNFVPNLFSVLSMLRLSPKNTASLESKGSSK